MSQKKKPTVQQNKPKKKTREDKKKIFIRVGAIMCATLMTLSVLLSVFFVR